jgi:hypothetical protein
MFSRWFARLAGVSIVCLAVSTAASAQYGGGGSTGSGGSGSSSAANSSGYGSGSGKAIGIGVGAAAGAAVGIALLIHHHHAAARSEVSVIGCTQSMLNRISLKNENDNQIYAILSSGTHLQAGERVELKGFVTDAGSGTQALRVRSLVNNYGTCGPAASAKEKSAAEKNEMAQVSK